jgi:hypothetical protein
MQQGSDGGTARRGENALRCDCYLLVAQDCAFETATGRSGTDTNHASLKRQEVRLGDW